jgi:hypothetical protein
VASVFTQHRTHEGGDQSLRRMAKDEMLRRQPCRKFDLSLSVENIQQPGADHCGFGW